MRFLAPSQSICLGADVSNSEFQVQREEFAPSQKYERMVGLTLEVNRFLAQNHWYYFLWVCNKTKHAWSLKGVIPFNMYTTDTK